MSSDTSNLFSKAEVREIKRFTKGNITFKHYTFYNNDISKLFTTTQNGADTKALYTMPLSTNFPVSNLAIVGDFFTVS